MTMTAGYADVSAAVALFRGLADPTRLAIVRHLALGEHRVVDLTTHLGLAQSTVSGTSPAFATAGWSRLAPTAGRRCTRWPDPSCWICSSPPSTCWTRRVTQ
jgi:DNA-binding transcriptional ArsR family regulator